ncbi:MAG: short chain dehydrogenase, partial [Massilia sp.]|nr:short chain dehydrogenase [Aquabacterium sp.]
LKDRFISPALTADLARWVPKLTRRELQAGHWVTLQQPQVFAQAVREFVGALPVEIACAEPSRGDARQST